MNDALRYNLRGLTGQFTLAQLLVLERGIRDWRHLPPLTVPQILTWAERHHQRTGAWPTQDSGAIPEAPGESWASVDAALVGAGRGLPGKSSLARLLGEQKGLPYHLLRPRLTVRQILAWARAHRCRAGRWPMGKSGPIPEAAGENWGIVDVALRYGCRGLRGGSSLSRLLAARRRSATSSYRPRLSLSKILSWADRHHQRTGQWPSGDSGPIPEAPGETWATVNRALRFKQRGLIFGGSVTRLLCERRGLRRNQYLPPLSEKQILAWAEKHHQCTGAWPCDRSGTIPEAPGETWKKIDRALFHGLRGLTAGQSLASLLAKKRGVRNRTNLPLLCLSDILSWARAHHHRSGSWPTSASGTILEAPEENWNRVDMALRYGHRGLPGGSSLSRLLAQHLGIPNRSSLPVLRIEQILAWADTHFHHTGAWPSVSSGTIAGTSGETWIGVDRALRYGYRGLPGRSSLANLLNKHRR